MTSYVVKQMQVDHDDNLKKGDIVVFFSTVDTSQYFWIDMNKGTNEGWNVTTLGEKKLKTIGTWIGNVGGAKSTIRKTQFNSFKKFVDRHTGLNT